MCTLRQYLLLYLLIFLLFFVQAQGQHYEVSPDQFRVRKLDTFIQFPFLGGLNTPSIQWSDLNGDGFQDLFLFDSGQFFSFLTDRSPTLHFHPVFHDSTPVQDWFLLADLDGDGRDDLFCGDGKSHVLFYRNTGDSTRWFDLSSPENIQTTDKTPVLSESISYPALYDLDGDGDLDFLTGNSIGTLTLYRNVGTPQKAQWKFETESFGGIIVLLDTVIVKQSIIKKGGQEEVLHGASSVTLFDIDNDGLPDLFFGDYYTRTVLYFKNIGPHSAPKFNFVSRIYPIQDSTETIGFNRTIFTQTPVPDLFVTVNFPTTETDNFYYYKNTGTPGKPNYVRQTKNYLSTLDAGRNSHVCWADFNQDGKQDFIISGEKGGIQAYQQDTDSSFHWISDNWGNLPALSGSAPSLVDLNNDSLPDCVIGQYDGTLRAYKNIGLPNFPLFSDWNSIVPHQDFGSYIVPAFADLDGDGDADMVISNAAGILFFFENIGTIAAPVFRQRSTGLDSTHSLSISPLLADWNGDGRPDIITGNAEGVISVFYTKGNWLFSPTPDLVFKTSVATIAPAAIMRTADSLHDIIAGCARGGIVYLKAMPEKDSIPQPQPGESLRLYPNPSASAITISSPAIIQAIHCIAVDGRETFLPFTVAGTIATMQISSLAEGMYFLRIVTETGVYHTIFVKIE